MRPLTVNSMSEMSEDIDLEYDLYDCDLNNVSAQPGSMFGHAMTYYFDDDDDIDGLMTPTARGDVIEMTQLFPDTSGGSSGSDKGMTESRTSDLTTSVTSTDLTRASDSAYSSACYYSLSSATATASVVQPKTHKLDLSHLDELTFVDD